jgi:hypothetical protein
MPLRVICFALSLCLFWAGIGSFESPALVAEPSCYAQASADVAGDTQADAGTVADHHLDDLPSQSVADAQTVGLPPPPLLQPWTPAGSCPASGPQPCMPTPYIEGLQRPPRGALARLA